MGKDISHYKSKLSVEASRYTGDNWVVIARWAGFHRTSDGMEEIQNFNRIGTYLPITGDFQASCGELWSAYYKQWVEVPVGYWVVKDLVGLFVLSNDSFWKIYERL